MILVEKEWKLNSFCESQTLCIWLKISCHKIIGNIRFFKYVWSFSGHQPLKSYLYSNSIRSICELSNVHCTKNENFSLTFHTIFSVSDLCFVLKFKPLTNAVVDIWQWSNYASDIDFCNKLDQRLVVKFNLHRIKHRSYFTSEIRRK